MVMENERLWELFHRKWSRDVGTEGYDKHEWVELEKEILALIKLTKIQDKPYYPCLGGDTWSHAVSGPPSDFI